MNDEDDAENKVSSLLTPRGTTRLISQGERQFWKKREQWITSRTIPTIISTRERTRAKHVFT